MYKYLEYYIEYLFSIVDQRHVLFERWFITKGYTIASMVDKFPS